MFCIVSWPKPPCVFATVWFRPFTMAENSLVDSKFKGMTHSAPVNPLNYLHIEEPTGYLFNLFVYTLPKV